MRRSPRVLSLMGALALTLLVGNSVVAAAWQSPLDDPARPGADRQRDEGSRPLEVYAWLGIGEGMTVADIIPSAGYNSHVLARLVGANGKVVSAYTSEDGAKALDERFHSAGLHNVEAHRSLDNIADDSVDATVIVRNIHDMFIPSVVEQYGMDPNAILAEVLRTLKPGGVLGIVDARATEGVDETNHRISEDKCIDELEARGFELVERSDLLANADDDRTTPKWEQRWSVDRLLLKFRKPAH